MKIRPRKASEAVLGAKRLPGVLQGCLRVPREPKIRQSFVKKSITLLCSTLLHFTLLYFTLLSNFHVNTSFAPTSCDTTSERGGLGVSPLGYLSSHEY